MPGDYGKYYKSRTSNYGSGNREVKAEWDIKIYGTQIRGDLDIETLSLGIKQ